MPIKEPGMRMAMYNSQGTPVIDDTDISIIRHAIGNIATNKSQDVTLTTYISTMCEVTIVFSMDVLPTTGSLFVGQVGSLLNDSNQVERFDYQATSVATLVTSRPTDAKYTVKRTFHGLQGITINNGLDQTIQGATILVVPFTQTTWRKNHHG